MTRKLLTALLFFPFSWICNPVVKEYKDLPSDITTNKMLVRITNADIQKTAGFGNPPELDTKLQHNAQFGIIFSEYTK